MRTPIQNRPVKVRAHERRGRSVSQYTRAIKTIPSESVDEMIRLADQGLSTREISRITGVPYSTVWNYTKTHLKATSSKPGPLRSDWKRTSPELAYIAGVLMGDGHIVPSENPAAGLRLNVVDEDFADEFSQALEEQFGRLARKYKRATRCMIVNGRKYNCQNQFHIQFYSKDVAAFAKTLDETWVRQLPPEYKIAWLRGAWDSEGSVYKRRDGKRLTVEFGGVSEEWFAKLFSDALHEIGIEAKVSSPQVYGPKLKSRWRVRIHDQEDVRRFFRLVNPTIARKRKLFEGMRQ